MKKFLLIILLFFPMSLNLIFGQNVPRKVMKIDLADVKIETIKEFYKLGLDITQFDRDNNSVNVLVTEPEMQKITRLGLESEVVIPDADAFAHQLRESNYLERFHNYDEILQEMNAIVSSHPELALLEDIGDSYDKTIGRGGHDIWAMKISDNVQVEEAEPEVFYMGNLHAREIITPEIIMYFMHYLIDNYGKDGYVTYLVNNRQIWLSPTTNPDGHAFVLTGENPSNGGDPMWWRKNKRDNNGNGIFDPSDGVDLNRNFGYKWGFDNSGSSPEPSSAIYRGTGPFSEPETQAIRDFVVRHQFIMNLSFHSYSQLWLYPWGYKRNLTPDNAIFVAMADSCVAYNHYTPEPGYELYTTNGGSDDWFYGEQLTKNKIFSFTPEVGNFAESVNGNTGFFPDTSFIQKQILENQGPMLYLTYIAGEPPIIEHQPLTETESPGPYLITAKIKPPLLLTTPVPLDPSSYKIFYNATGVAPFDSVTMQATGNPDEFIANIPAISGVQKIYYYLRAADQKNRIGVMPKGAPMATYLFKIGADLMPPSISHTPYTYSSVFAKAIVISAMVTDNIGISKVKLFYRKNGGQPDSLAMMPTSKPNEYQATIIFQDLKEGDYYEYKIVAIDNSKQGNIAQAPESGYYRFLIKSSLLYDFELEGSFAPLAESDWEWGTPTSGPKSSHSGARVWATNLEGNYTDLTESILETPEISLAGKDSARLVFWHWYQNEFSDGKFWDGGNVKISVDGSSFFLIVPEGGYDGIIDPYNAYLGNEPCFGGPATNGNFWHQEFFDLTIYKNRAIKIRFHFGSDGAVSDLGWYVDDVEILFKNTSAVNDNPVANSLPVEFELSQNYPNPFNPTTAIQYSLAQPGEVTLEIFNLVGQKVKTLIQKNQAAGSYSVFWQGKDELNGSVSSGIYFYRLCVKGKNFSHVFMKKMVKLE